MARRTATDCHIGKRTLGAPDIILTVASAITAGFRGVEQIVC